MTRTEILEILTLNDSLKEGFGLLDSLFSLSLSIDAITEFAVEHKIASSMAARVFVVESLLTGASKTAIDPRWTQQLVTAIQYKKSGSGNMTWLCTLASGDELYIRQVNKSVWFEAGYTVLEDMRLGDQWDANITVYTAPGSNPSFIDCQRVEAGGTIAAPVKPAATDDGELLHIDFNIAQEARAWLDAGCYVLDTETTGLGSKDEVIQLAILDSTGTVLLDTLIKPTAAIGAKAVQIHGITEDMVKDAPAIAGLMVGDQTLYDWLLQHEGKIVTFNAEFDSRLLSQSLDQGTIEDIGFTFPYCAMSLYARHNGDYDDRKGDYRWVSLKNACDIEELPAPNHSALGDAHATLALVKHLARGMRLPF